jgi:hypothetical protein
MPLYWQEHPLSVRKGAMMKSISALVCKVILAVILGMFVVLPFGCSSTQLGETAAERHRRHGRIMRINQSELMADIETILLLDKPSKLTEMRIP